MKKKRIKKKRQWKKLIKIKKFYLSFFSSLLLQILVFMSRIGLAKYFSKKQKDLLKTR